MSHDEPPPLRPNSIHFHHGTTNFSEHFGGICSVDPVSLTGGGHHPHIEVRCQYGLRLDFDPDMFAELLRQGPAALAKFPVDPDLSGSRADLGGEGA